LTKYNKTLEISPIMQLSLCFMI